MDGNFLSRYKTKINEIKHTDELTEYIVKCLPFMKMYSDDTNTTNFNVDNVFNCKEIQGLNKRDIFKDYLAEVENMNIDRVMERKKEECPNCIDSNLFRINETAEIVCDGCGMVIETVLGEVLTYKEEQESSEKIINYSYKRENHFNEWLSQFQGQETTNIPPDVVEKLKNEFKKIKIKSVTDITHAKVRSLLKKLHLNKYYEHVPYITNILNGIRPPSMPQELEEKLRIMFTKIQKPFDNNCPSERKNFLSYSYVLYKFCELLEKDEYLEFFPLLKSKEKLHQQDVIWKKICNDLHWEYIPTI